MQVCTVHFARWGNRVMSRWQEIFHPTSDMSISALSRQLMYKYLKSNNLSIPHSVPRFILPRHHSITSFTMSQKHASPTGTSSTGIPWFNFPGYDDHGLISAATIIPQNRRIVFTSGQVGTDSEGKQPETLEDEMILAFEVINPSTDIQTSRTLTFSE